MLYNYNLILGMVIFKNLFHNNKFHLIIFKTNHLLDSSLLELGKLANKNLVKGIEWIVLNLLWNFLL